ncbi:MAG: histidine kinase [Burkholderiales bacterium]
MALMLAVAVPLLAFAAFLIHSNAAQSRRLAEFSALAIARDVAGATDEFLDASARMLPQLARRIHVSRDGHIECDPLLQQFHAVLPRIVNVAAFDAEGVLVCSALPLTGTRAPALHEPWFESTLHERRSVLTQARIGRITRKWISTYTYPLLDADARPRGVIALAIDLVRFAPVMRAMGLSAGAIAGIVHENGTIVARSLDPATWIGKSVAVPMSNIMAPGAAAGQGQARGIDGVERFHALVRIPGTPWIAYAGIPAGPLMDQESRNRTALYALTVVILIVAGAAALVLSRRIALPMRAMASVARAVAEGHIEQRAPVSGPREIREVAQEFNHMIEVRQTAETELRDLANRLRALSRRLIEVEETERRAVNRELHDRIGQNLAVLNLNLELVRTQLPENAPADLKTRLTDARAMVEITAKEVRNVMADLRPPALDDYGLVAALGTYVDSFVERTGITVSFTGEHVAPRLPLVTETALFRIAQEALTNVAKHARAQHVKLTVQSSSGSVVLSVADDGVGFAACATGTAPSSWGLTTMRERADAVGAHLSIESVCALGTRVVVEVRQKLGFAPTSVLPPVRNVLSR